MKVAILGATGAVGRTMLEALEARTELPIEEIVPLASERSRGTPIRWRGRTYEVDVPSPERFRGCAVALFSAGASRSREWAPIAAAEGAVVVDNSSAWRMDPRVPLVVPEVNAHRIAERPLGIVANPNCVATQLVLALEAVRRAAGLRRVVASTYQSVSGAGQAGLDAFLAESRGEVAEGSPFNGRIAGNVIPAVGPRGEDGWNEEERKVRDETRRILEMPGLPIAATCVRVPVEVGHGVAAMLELERAVDRAELLAALRAMPGVEVVDGEADALPRDVAGTDTVLVGRVRVDPDDARVAHLWVVGDNLRKGAAVNSIQIAERVIRE